MSTQPSPTAGMNIAQRIMHVGGRNNAAGYVEFGSTQAVEVLVHQVLRDLPAQPSLTDAQKEAGWDAYRKRFNLNDSTDSGWRAWMEACEFCEAAIATQAAQPERKLLGYLSEHNIAESSPYRWQFSKTSRGVYRDNAIRVLAVYEDGEEQPVQAQGVPTGGTNVFQTMAPDAKEALARLERVACLQTTAKHNDDIHHIRLYLIAQQLAPAPQAAPQQAEPPSEEPDLAHPQYRAGWNDAMNSMTKAMLRPSGIGTKGAK